MGEKRPKSAFGVVAGLSVTVCLMASGCTTSRPAGEGEAVTASANLSSDRGLAVSDAAPDLSDALSDPVGSSDLEAVVVPPAGWLPDPVKRSRNHAHQAWISPSGSTAYGVIRMNLPLPFIGPDVVLPRFLEQMRQTEGAATLLSRRNDGRLPGIRFVAEGGQYRLRANLVTRGFRAWAVYAGTLRDQPEVSDELQLAEAAREKTRIGTTRVRSRNR